jgi:hypothetical protein
MPYITQIQREPMQKSLETLSFEITSPGELNYAITMLCHKYLAAKDPFGMENKYDARYQSHNDVIGVLSAAQMEFYRRLSAPYEDRVMIQNGDV